MHMLSKGRLAHALLVGAFAAAAGCSEHADEPNGPGGGPPPATQSVAVEDNQFVASTVPVTLGGTVRWTWRGSNPHNVTFTGGPASATQSTGTYERTFTTAGSYAYHCTIHGQSMSGTVNVVMPTEPPDDGGY